MQNAGHTQPKPQTHTHTQRHRSASTDTHEHLNTQAQTRTNTEHTQTRPHTNTTTHNNKHRHTHRHKHTFQSQPRMIHKKHRPALINSPMIRMIRTSYGLTNERTKLKYMLQFVAAYRRSSFVQVHCSGCTPIHGTPVQFSRRQSITAERFV